MSKSTRVRQSRRKRRTARQVIAHGESAKRKHKRKTGRTGSIRFKRFLTLMEQHLDRFSVATQKEILGIKRA